MNEESKYPSIEPELEARIVSLVLGEASDFEAEELDRLIRQRPELAAFKLRMQTTHGLLQDVGAGEFHSPSGDWKLSDNTRNAVLAVIRGEGVIRPVSQDVGDTPQQHTAARRNWRWNLAKATAGVCAAGFVAVLAWPSFFSAESLIADRRSHWGFVSDEMPAVVQVDRADLGESLSSGTTQLYISEADKLSSYKALKDGEGRPAVSGKFGPDEVFGETSGSTETADALSAIRNTLSAEANAWSESTVDADVGGDMHVLDARRLSEEGASVSRYSIQWEDQERSVLEQQKQRLASPLMVDGLRWGAKVTDKDGDGIGNDTLNWAFDFRGVDAGLELRDASELESLSEPIELATAAPTPRGDAVIVGSSLWDRSDGYDDQGVSIGRLFGREKESGSSDDLALLSPQIIIENDDQIVEEAPQSRGEITKEIQSLNQSLNGILGFSGVAQPDGKSTESFGLETRDSRAGQGQQSGGQRKASEGADIGRQFFKDRLGVLADGRSNSSEIVDEGKWKGDEQRSLQPEWSANRAIESGDVDRRFGNETKKMLELDRGETAGPAGGIMNEEGEGFSSYQRDWHFNGGTATGGAANGNGRAGGNATGGRGGEILGNVGGFGGGSSGGFGGGGRGGRGLAELTGTEPLSSYGEKLPEANKNIGPTGQTEQGLGVDGREMPSVRRPIALDHDEAKGVIVFSDGAAPLEVGDVMDLVVPVTPSRPEITSGKRDSTTNFLSRNSKKSDKQLPAAVYTDDNVVYPSFESKLFRGSDIANTTRPVMPGLSAESDGQAMVQPPQTRIARPSSSVNGPGPGLPVDDLSGRFERDGIDNQILAVPKYRAKQKLMERGRSRVSGSDTQEGFTFNRPDTVDSKQQEKKTKPAAQAAPEFNRRGQSRIAGSSVLEGVTVEIAKGFKQFGSQQRTSDRLLSDLLLEDSRYRRVPIDDFKSSLKRPPAIERVAPSVELNEKNATDEAFSTFSLHVSDVSFKLALAALSRGEWPEAAKVRIEEFVNAFDYGDPMPCHDEKVACAIEQSIHPFVQQRNLLRVSMKTAAAGRASKTPLRLTFLLDNSGSMERIDRQQTVRRAFALLAQQLKPIDQVTLISFARQPRLLADKVSGTEANKLVGLIDELPSQGGTNIESALQLAFEKAREQQTPNAQNRIILLTDGAVNLGNANPESLSQMVTRIRSTGIAFDAAGISAEGLNDEVLEALTRQGDGRYYLLDSIESADESFASQIAGALRPSAKNVKVQVEFNPKRVGHYKLLGFEKHILEKEDFRNDSVDAAEMAAAEAGVAMYQFEAMPDGEGDVGSVSVRFRDLSTGQMVENRWPIPYQADAPRPDQAAPSLRIAASAALLAAKLKGQPLGESVDLRALSNLVAGLPEQDRNDKRVQQLQQMIEQARQLTEK